MMLATNKLLEILSHNLLSLGSRTNVADKYFIWFIMDNRN
jgi:hypothetical protein